MLLVKEVLACPVITKVSPTPWIDDLPSIILMNPVPPELCSFIASTDAFSVPAHTEIVPVSSIWSCCVPLYISLDVPPVYLL